MRLTILALATLAAGPAAAHPGHLADVAGHGHWVAGAAIGAAIALGLWEAWKGRGKDREEPKADEEDAPA